MSGDTFGDVLAGLAGVGWDFGIASFDGDSLVICAGTSIEYAEPIVKLGGVSYLELPTEFSHAVFSIASNEQRDLLGRRVPLEADDVVVRIEAETMAVLETQCFFVVASSAQSVRTARS